MLPIIRVPEILAKGMESFRKVFCRAEGFEPTFHTPLVEVAYFTVCLAN
jgi:hypothetical protein